MTLWHKPTEKPRGGDYGTLIVKRSTGYQAMYTIDFRYRKPDWTKWCYLSDLLKLERENKKLKKELEKIKENLSII